jgi:hypothetical protein
VQIKPYIVLLIAALLIIWLWILTLAAVCLLLNPLFYFLDYFVEESHPDRWSEGYSIDVEDFVEKLKALRF